MKSQESLKEGDPPHSVLIGGKLSVHLCVIVDSCLVPTFLLQLLNCMTLSLSLFNHQLV